MDTLEAQTLESVLSVLTEEQKKFFYAICDCNQNSVHGFSEELRRKRHMYFDEYGKARLANIMGYIGGANFSGNYALGVRMATELLSVFDRLAPVNHTRVLELRDGAITVPAYKVVLSDDRTLHGFTFTKLSPVCPDRFEEIGKTKQDFRIVERFGIYDSIYSDSVTESVWSEPRKKHINVYYQFAYNGGVIYHGPGAGNTFTVQVSKSSYFWGIHT